MDTASNNSSDKSVMVCEKCVISKQTRQPFSNFEGKRSRRVLELIHSDVCGPITPVGQNGERYFVTFIDDWSHFVMVFPMKNKDEVFELFKMYVTLVTAKFSTKISRLKCDNGGEYKNHVFEAFCRQQGIQIEYTIPYTPEQNGTSERMNRTIAERARAMLEDAKIDKRFWVQAVQTAGYVVNRCPTRANNNQTPAEIWNNTKPDVSKLRVFDVSVFVHIPKEHRKKLDAKAWKGVFVGYAPTGYRIWNPKTRSIVTARDVDFLEMETPVDSEGGECSYRYNNSDVIVLEQEQVDPVSDVDDRESIVIDESMGSDEQK